MISIRTGYHIVLEIANGVAPYILVLATESRSHILRLRGVLACGMGRGIWTSDIVQQRACQGP